MQACVPLACLLVSYRPLAHAGFLTREPWKPRPGDGISSNWLIAELTHRQAHGSNSQIPMEADRAPTPTSHWGLALWRRGVAERTYEVLAPPPKDQSWGPDSIVLRLGPGVSLPMRTGRTDDMRSWSHRPRLSPTRSNTRGTDDSRPPTSATIGGRDPRSVLLASVLTLGRQRTRSKRLRGVSAPRSTAAGRVIF